MLQEFTEMNIVNIAQLGGAVKAKIVSSGLQLADIPGLDELFAPSSSFCRPFDGLDTYYRQLSFFKEHLNFVVVRRHSKPIMHFVIKAPNFAHL